MSHILTHIGKSRILFRKNRAMSHRLWHRGYPANLLQPYFIFCHFAEMISARDFWVTRQGIFRKLFPGQFHELHPWKKFPKIRSRFKRFPAKYFHANFLFEMLIFIFQNCLKRSGKSFIFFCFQNLRFRKIPWPIPYII